MALWKGTENHPEVFFLGTEEQGRVQYWMGVRRYVRNDRRKMLYSGEEHRGGVWQFSQMLCSWVMQFGERSHYPAVPPPACIFYLTCHHWLLGCRPPVVLMAACTLTTNSIAWIRQVHCTKDYCYCMQTQQQWSSNCSNGDLINPVMTQLRKWIFSQAESSAASSQV